MDVLLAGGWVAWMVDVRVERTGGTEVVATAAVWVADLVAAKDEPRAADSVV